MELPSRLTRLIKKISTGTAVEDKLLKLFVARLKHNLSTLEELFGSKCGKVQFSELIKRALSGANSACFDQYAASMEDAVTKRRSLTEQEGWLVGEMVDQIISMTELLLDLAGVTRPESESEESGTGAAGAIDLREFSSHN